MEYYVQQFNRNIFKWAPKNLRRNAQNRVIDTSDFKPIKETICINKGFVDEYSKSKWKKPLLRWDQNVRDDLVLNFN
jgi:hypothetical protein